MIMPKKSARRTALRVYLVSAVMLLSIAFYLAGIEPTNSLPGSKVSPLDVTADGLTLIAGSPIGDSRVVGPIRFLNLADGNDSSPPLALEERDEVVTISTAKLSDDNQRLLIVETRLELSLERFFLTVFDLPSRRVLLEKTIPFDGMSGETDLAQFSRDGRLLAWATTQNQGLGRRPRQDTVVWDLGASKERLHLSGRDCSFQLSPDGKLLASRDDRWTKIRVFPYDLGTSLLSGTVWPYPWATGHAGQFGVIYETAGGWWTGPGKSPGTASSDLMRLLGLNIPRGVGLDLVDAVTGTTRTYHLGSALRRFAFPRAGKILTQSGDATDVWDMPPRRTYRAVAMIASILIGIGILWLTLDFSVRRVARWYRGAQQMAEAV